MIFHYNHVAGKSLDRISALVDGVFAFAMTLMVFEFHLPPHGMVHSEMDLVNVLIGLAPNFLIYLLSFLTLGLYWVGQQTLMSHMARSDRHFTWMNLLFLVLITLLPFSTKLLGEFIEYRTALLAYWANLFLLGVVIYANWAYACTAKLIKQDKTTQETYMAINRRVIQAEILYTFGAALCYFGTTYSIVFIVLVQLNYALAPKVTSRLTA